MYKPKRHKVGSQVKNDIRSAARQLAEDRLQCEAQGELSLDAEASAWAFDGLGAELMRKKSGGNSRAQLARMVLVESQRMEVLIDLRQLAIEENQLALH